MTAARSLLATLVLASACRSMDVPPVRLATPGFIVLGGWFDTPAPFVAGDTLWEITIAEAPRAVRTRMHRVARHLEYPRACMRAFHGRDRFVAHYAPSCPEMPTCRTFVDCPRERTAIYDPSGRIMSDSAFIGWQWELPETVVCPNHRGRDGRPATPAPYDGCFRRPPIGDWRQATPGIPMPHGVLFPDPIQRGLFVRCSRRTPEADGEWTPSAEDIAALERGLPDFIRTFAWNEWGDSAGPLHEYVRQYGGFTRAGRRYVYVSLNLRWDFLPEEHFWRRAPIDQCDGGWSSIGVVYDVEAGTFSELENAGYA